MSDHHQGALFLAKVMLQYSQFNSYLQGTKLPDDDLKRLKHVRVF